MEKDPIVAYIDKLKEEMEYVIDPLEHECFWGTTEEWRNIAPLVAKYCIHTQGHLHAVVEYLASRKDEETTAHLRAFCEDVNQRQDATFVEYKVSSTKDI